MSLRVLWFVCLVPLVCQGCGKSNVHSHSAPPASAGPSTEEHDDPLATGVAGQMEGASSPTGTAGAPSGDSNAPETCAELSQLACRKLAECAPFALSTGYGTKAACTAAVAAACAHFDASGAPVDRVTCT